MDKKTDMQKVVKRKPVAVLQKVNRLSGPPYKEVVTVLSYTYKN